MKWLVALVALIAAASIGVAAKVILDNRDTVPPDTRACLRKAGIEPVRSTDGLTTLRGDVDAGTLRVVQRWDWGRTSGVLLRGAGDDYAALVLWNADTPSPLGRGGARRVYEHPNRVPLIAVQLPDQGDLRRCALRN